MSYKRQLWSSGYEYHIRCPYCGTPSKYTDRDLGYRSWYPNGFIYCPHCRKPLRHNEIYAVHPDGTPVYRTQEEANQSVQNGYLQATGYPAAAMAPHTAAPAGSNGVAPGIAYCTNCGRQYKLGQDHFCAGCGKKLD